MLIPLLFTIFYTYDCETFCEAALTYIKIVKLLSDYDNLKQTSQQFYTSLNIMYNSIRSWHEFEQFYNEIRFSN